MKELFTIFGDTNHANKKEQEENHQEENHQEDDQPQEVFEAQEVVTVSIGSLGPKMALNMVAA